ncbi:MAG: ATP-binding protein [bacterium]|nr:ATP-binding protein [bacterium]
MDLSLELLSIQNPWWRGESLKFDPAIEQYNRQAIKRPADILTAADLKQDKIYFLAGLKGAGKTTLMKLLIKKLIEEDKIQPQRVFFYSCHNLDSYEQLNEIIKLFLNSRSGGRRYIFIDEIGLVKNWRKGLDYLIKAGKLKNTALALSASSVDGKTEDERVIISRDVNNLTFREFANLINPALFKKITPKNYQAHAKKLEYYLDIYFLTGGFISAIGDYQKYGAVRQLIYVNFLHWFLAYISRMGRDTILTRQIMEKLILNLGQPVGFKTLIHKTKAKTHLTAAGYVEMLENMLAVKTIYQTGVRGQASRKAKKVYFTDPFIFWLFYSYIHGSLDYWRFSRQRLHDGAVFSHLVENVVLSQLIKDENNLVTYWRDNIKKQEINFIVESGKKITPILLRYGQEIRDDDFYVLKRGIIISQDRLETRGSVKIMPLIYFLLFGYLGQRHSVSCGHRVS